MKTKLIAGIFLIIALFSNCKNEKTTENKTEETPKVEDTFNVTIDALIKKDDKLNLFYTTDGSIDFTQIEPLWFEAKGSDQVQKIVYHLPAGTLPTQIRLDFGMNKEQEDVVLNSISMEYKGKTKTIGMMELKNYFMPDESKCTFDPETGTIKAKLNNGVKNYSLYPQEALSAEISKLLQ